MFKLLSKIFLLVASITILLCTPGRSQSASWNEFSQQLEFRNIGTVTSDMKYLHVTKPVFYVETEENWFRSGTHDYLYEIENGEPVDPPSGIRSSVPLGGLGAGTVELRGNGCLEDWNIFNNMPFSANDESQVLAADVGIVGLKEAFSTGKKTQIRDAYLALRVKESSGNSVAVALRTDPLPDGQSTIEEIDYSGSFPVSRLSFKDDRIPLDATLFAYSEFRMRDAERSATPCALFSLELRNPTNNPIEASFLFNMPNAIDGEFSVEEGLMLSSSQAGLTRGDMALEASGADRVSYGTSANAQTLWKHFEENGDTIFRESKATYGAINATALVQPGETRVITIAMAWYFPDRLAIRDNFPIKGNHYTNLFKDSREVVETALARLPETRADILEWHQTCFDNTLPDWLQDALVNSVATMYKTSLWGADGQFVQWESFSCPNVEPIHITFSRSLPYMFFFPELERQIIREFGPIQREDGYITEKLWSKTVPRTLGDCNPVFILSVYMIHKWMGDDAFLDEMWPHIERAAEWQMEQSQTFGLPNDLACTYDLSGFQKYSVLAYNAVMHVAGLQAAIAIGKTRGEQAFVDRCQQNLERGRRSLEEKLWNGSFYPAYWDVEAGKSEVMHADALYGQLWAFILGLGDVLPRETVKSHLAMEEKYSDTPYGLRIMANTAEGADTGSKRGSTVWQIASLTWSGLNLYLGDEDAEASLSQGKKVVNHWRLKLNDQWDYKDLSAAKDGTPYCNSHYTRQLMFWSFPLALIGQDYSASEKRLSFAPRVEAPYRLPFFTPTANGVLEAASDGSMHLQVYSGELDLRQLVVAGKVIHGQLSLQARDRVKLNP